MSITASFLEPAARRIPKVTPGGAIAGHDSDPARSPVARQCGLTAGSFSHDFRSVSVARPQSIAGGTSSSALEREADLVADTIVGGTSRSVLRISSVNHSVLQRKEKYQTEKAAAKKTAEAFLKTDLGKKIEAEAKARGKEFLATTAGKVIAGSVAAGAVAAIFASNAELPLQLPEIPLDIMYPGLKMKITYEGPVRNPTKAMISFSGTFDGPAAEKKSAVSETENLRSGNARLARELFNFREMLKTPEQKKEDQQFWDAYWRMKASDPLSPLRLPLQRKAGGGGEHLAQAVPPLVHQVLRSPGEPLAAGTRQFMEERFGHDFSRVRIHHDAAAQASASAVRARAYTVGHKIVFAAGEYAPGSGAGGRLLAHELTHVVQQGAGNSRVRR